MHCRQYTNRRSTSLIVAICCSWNHSAQTFSWRQNTATLQSLQVLRQRRSFVYCDRQRQPHSHQCRCNSVLSAKKNNVNDAPLDLTKSKKRQPKKRKAASTFSTAVCIVPPDEAWDSIQRARHLARDTSFYKVSSSYSY